MELSYAPQTRAVRPRWLLEEIGAPYDLIRLDFSKNEHKGPTTGSRCGIAHGRPRRYGRRMHKGVGAHTKAARAVARKTARRAPVRAEHGRAPRRHAGKPGSVAARPLITRAELRRAVLELANTLAPADVADLLAEESILRAHAARLDGAAGTILRAQLELAIACLRDYIAGECPQIPFYTISLLAAGLAYLVEDLDIVPDFLPRIGTLDDAMVMALACQLGTDGLRRYCTWKGIALEPALALDGRARRSRRSPVRARTGMLD